MFREIRKMKVNEIKEKEERERNLGYRQIKPEKNRSIEELESIIKLIFEQAAADAAKG